MKMSRLLVANFGHRDARYRTNLFDFAPDGDPKATLISQENGHGKTTAIGAALAIFEPKMERFVQRLRNPDARFQHYLPRKGTSIVVVELARDPDLLGVRGKVILGFIAAFKTGSADMRRKFFGFAETAQLKFDDLPFEGIVNDLPKLTVYDDIENWLHERKADALANVGVFYTETQHEWLTYMRQRGVPVDQIAFQSRFASSEGGIDKLLSFKEEGFVEKMSRLTGLDTLISEEWTEFRSAVDRSRDRPVTERRLASIQDLSSLLTDLSAEVGRERLAKATDDAAVADLQSFHDAMFALRDGLRETLGERREVAFRNTEAIGILDGALVDLDRRQRIAAAVETGFRLSDAEERSARVQASIDLETARIASTEVALHRAKLGRLEIDLRLAREELDKVNASLEDQVVPLRQAGRMLIDAVERELFSLTGRDARHEQEEADARTDLDTIRRERRGLDLELQAVTSSVDRSEQASEAIGRVDQRLRSAGSVNASETMTEALSRYEAAEREASAMVLRVEDEIQEVRDGLNGSRTRIATLDVDERTATRDLAAIGRDMDLRRGLFATIEEERRATNEFDIGETVTPEIMIPDLDDRIAIVERLVLQTDRAIEETEREIDFLSKGVAFATEEVVTVITHLKEKGINCVPALERVRANDGRDPDRAWSRVEKDPALVLTVHVERREDVDRAIDLTRAAELPILRPVRIGFYDPNEDHGPVSDRFGVVRPTRDDAYAGERQEIRQQTAKTTLEDLTKERAARHLRLSALRALGVRRASLASQEEQRSLASMEAEAHEVAHRLGTVRRDIEATRLAEADATRRLTDLQGRLATVQKDEKTARGTARSLAMEIAGIRSYQEMLLNPSDLVKARVRIDEIERSLSDCDERTHDIETLQIDLRRSREEVRDLANVYRTLVASVAYAQDGPVDDAGEASIEDLQHTYEMRLTAYQERMDGIVRDASKLYEQARSAHEAEKAAEERAVSRFSGDHDVLEREVATTIAQGSDERIDEYGRQAKARNDGFLREKGAVDVDVNRIRADMVRVGEALVLVGITAPHAELVVSSGLDDEAAARGEISTVTHETAEAKRSLVDLQRVASALKDEVDALARRVEKLDEVYLVGKVRVDMTAAPIADDPDLWKQRRSELEKARRATEEVLSAARRASRDASGAVERFIQNDMLRSMSEGQIEQDVRIRHAMDRLLAVGHEQLCEGAQDNARNLADIVASLEQKLAESSRWKSLTIRSLERCMEKVLTVFERALAVKMQDERFGGQRILKYDNSIREMGKVVPVAAGSFFDRSVEGSIGASGDENQFVSRMFDHLVRASGQNEKGRFRILKVVAHSDGVAYDDVEHVVASGGQQLTAAVLLYLMAIRTSQDVDQSRTDSGMFLIMDNSLGIANSKGLVDMQISLAEKLGVQIIVFSGIKGDVLLSFPVIYHAQASRGAVRSFRATDKDLGRDLLDEEDEAA